MEQIVLNINSQYSVAFLNFLKTLNYVEVKKVEKNIEDISAEIGKSDVISLIAGAWQDDRTAEEIIEDIHKSRHFNRKIEDL